jgi:hypothetical protein
MYRNCSDTFCLATITAAPTIHTSSGAALRVFARECCVCVLGGPKEFTELSYELCAISFVI